MGRNKSFDETEVIDKAVHLFWTNGYSATSVRDLEMAMGLTTASLYNAFGSKKSLFRRSLQRYLDLSSRRRIALLDASDEPAVAIEAFLRAVVASSSAGRDGCLLVNSAAEVAAHDDDIAEDVAAGLGEVEAALARALRRGRADGSIPCDIEVEPFAKALLGTVVAIRVMSRTSVGPQYLEALAESQIALLRRDDRDASGAEASA